MTVLIDTHKAINQLVSTGVQQKQAEAIVDVFSRTSEELVTKTDLKLLEERLMRKMYSQTIAIVGILSAVIGVIEFLTRK